MKFVALPIAGAMRIEPEAHADARGHFARVFCREEFEAHGLVGALSQMSVSWNHKAGTLRGMHYQIAPWGENKLVRATRGALFDVLLDLRPSSPSYRQWTGVELSADNAHAVYIPAGVAHGFLTQVDGTEVLYAMDVPFRPEAARGLRWNDPAFGIAWPQMQGLIISERDAGYPDHEATP